ncbi:MarR family winged helix-turn-helix transcriptional regulator [Sphingomonas sp. LT1P40]|uniref:MarR family winged helix-turn-helix transcriptional regulator n=1 Tax=Alteristakelama amylovorans TaxID=3096166 RepID=UPI002FCB961B
MAATLYDEALLPAGLSTTQFAILRTLDRIGATSLTGLGEAACYDRSTLNRLLRPLEDLGFVVSGSGTDARARIVRLSDTGKAAIKRATPLWEKAQASVHARMGGDLETLHTLLARMEELRP